MQMNKLAEALGMDPVSIRLMNAVRQDQTMATGTPPPNPVTVPQVARAAAERFGWQEGANGWKPPARSQPAAPHLRRGFGVAVGFKNIGFSFGYQENCWARVELHGNAEIEHVVLYHAGAEVGQGTHTIMAQMVAQAVGVPMEKVSLVLSDTAVTGDSGSASASRMTFMAGNAIRGAAERALQAWREEQRPAIGEYTYLAPKTTPLDKETGYATPNFIYAYSAQAVEGVPSSNS
jgi:Aerobic-type carbon monoxide dehydrogenase, large subunit CoxL/CutL homologs